MSDPRYSGPSFPRIPSPPPPPPPQGLQPSYNYPYPRSATDPYAQSYPQPSPTQALPPPPSLHHDYHQSAPSPHHSLPPPPSHSRQSYAQHPLLAYPTGLSSSSNHQQSPPQPHASSSTSVPSNGPPPPPSARSYYQPYPSYDQPQISLPPPRQYQSTPEHYQQQQQQPYHYHEHDQDQHSPPLPRPRQNSSHQLDLAPLGGIQLPALRVSASPEIRQHRERLPSLTSLGEVVAPLYSGGGGMPVGGPASGFGGDNEDRFAGRPVPPKASKSRKIARVQYQEVGEGDDGSSRGGDEEEGAEDLDPLTGKKRKRQRAGPGGDSLTCHQCRGYYESGLRCSMNKLSAKGKLWKQCILVYCDRDVMYRYGVDPEAVRNGPPPSEEDVQIGNHSAEARYKWTCPSCENICQCSICRKKNGLEPVGNLSIKTNNSGKRTASDLLKNGSGKGQTKLGSDRGGTPMDEDLSHLSTEERTKFIKERERKIKLIAVAKERLEKLKTDVQAVTIEDAGVLFEEGRVAWEVDGDEGVAGRVDLREFFWRFRKFVPLPDKIFATLDNFDKPIAESTAKKMAVMMIDCLYSQVLKGSPPLGETPEAIEEELAVQKRIEVILADVKAALKPTTSALHLRKNLHALLLAFEVAEQPAEFASPSPRASMEGSIAPIDQDAITEEKIAKEEELVGEAPVASSSKIEDPVKEEVAEAIVQPAPSIPEGSDVALPTTTSLLISLSHRVLMSPDVRFDMEEGLAQRAEMIKLQGREVKAFVEGRGKKRLKLEAEMAVALGAAAKGVKLAEIDDLPREDYLEHLRLVTSQRLALHGVAGRSAAVLGVDAEDRIYVSLAPDWEGRKPTGWGVGIHVFGKGFDSVWPSSSNGIDTGTLVSSKTSSETGQASAPPKSDQPKKDEHLSLSPASTVEGAAYSAEPASSQWHHFPTHRSIRHLADVVAFQALHLAFERGDFILTVHLPTSTSPSQRVYPEDAWYHSSTNLGEFAEEGKVKELLTRMNEIADLLEMADLEDEEEVKLMRIEESNKAKEKAKEVEEPLGKRRRKSKP